MNLSFREQLRRLRIKKGISQQRLADMIHVDRSTIANWETGRRLPDASMIALLSDCLSVDTAELLRASEIGFAQPIFIVVDDEPVILDGELRVLERALPDAEIHGFTVPGEALAFSKLNRVNTAFLDIELGLTSGLDLCRELLKIDSRMNVVFLTAFREYALEAWDTGAKGFLVKPLSEEAVKKQLCRLFEPVGGISHD